MTAGGVDAQQRGRASAAPDVRISSCAVTEITTLLRARCSLIWVTTQEVGRARAITAAACRAAGFGQGHAREDESLQATCDRLPAKATSPRAHTLAEPDVEESCAVRSLRAAALRLRGTDEALIVISLRGLPATLREVARSVHLGVPTADDLGGILAGIARRLPVGRRPSPDVTRRIVDVGRGLLAEEFVDAVACALARCGQIDPAYIAHAKQRVVSASGLLSWIEVPSQPALGGHREFRAWAARRRMTVGPATHGLPFPRGVGLTGPSGVGKSAAILALAAEWGLPLLRFDPSRLMAQYIGESEDRLREVLDVVTVAAPCILWIDEVEKAFAGVSGRSESDGGLMARIFGTFLTWLQDRPAPACIAWTANRDDLIPPEFMRPGRCDAVFALGLPDEADRREIVAIHVARRHEAGARCDLSRFDDRAVARATAGMTGAQIEGVIIEGLLSACNAGEEFTAWHVLSTLNVAAVVAA